MLNKILILPKFCENFPNLLQYVAVSIGSMGFISTGMHIGWPAPYLPQLLSKNSTIPTTNSEGSWIAVMPLFGSILASFILFYIVNSVGRKCIIILSGVPLFIGWIMMGLAQSVTVLYITRFIVGLGMGFVYTGLPIYSAEITDPNIRGGLGLVCPLSFMSGFLVISIVGTYFRMSTAAYISSVLPILFMLLFALMPESFYYHIMKGDMEKAKSNLKKFRKNINADEEVERIKNAIEEEIKNKGRFWDLFLIRSSRKSLFIMVGLYSFQQLSGAIAITQYLQIIITQTGANVSPDLMSIGYFGMMIVMGGLSTFLIDRIGRKPLLMTSTIGASIALLVEGGYFYLKNRTEIDTAQLSWVPCAALILFVTIFGIGMQYIPVVMLSELFPASVKLFAFPLCELYYNITVIVGTKLFQILNDSFGMHMPFFFFGTFASLGTVFVALFVPETKGKTLEDIQELLKIK